MLLQWVSQASFAQVPSLSLHLPSTPWLALILQCMEQLNSSLLCRVERSQEGWGGLFPSDVVLCTLKAYFWGTWGFLDIGAVHERIKPRIRVLLQVFWGKCRTVLLIRSAFRLARIWVSLEFACKWYSSKEACRQERVYLTWGLENVWRKWSLNSKPQIFTTESWFGGLHRANRRAEPPPHDCSNVTYDVWISNRCCRTPPRQSSGQRVFWQTILNKGCIWKFTCCPHYSCESFVWHLVVERIEKSKLRSRSLPWGSS